MSVDVLDKVIAAQDASEQRNRAAFRDIVLAVSSGREPKPAEVKLALEQSSMTIADLKNAVLQHKRRTAVREEIARLENGENQRAELVAKRDAAKAIYDVAVEAYENKIRPLNQEIMRLDNESVRVVALRADLRRDCPDAQLVNRAKEVRAELNALEQPLKDAANQLDRMKAGYMAELEERPPGERDWESPGGARGGDVRELKRLKGAVERAQSALGELVAKRDSLVLESDELVLRMIEA
jgi:hypothetical protein